MSSESHQSHFLIIEDDKGRREFILEGEVYSVGRDATCTVRLISQFVSRHHATIHRRTDDKGEVYYQLVDGDFKGKPSANGLLIDGHKTSYRNLEHRDEVIFGPRVKLTYFRLDRRNSGITGPADEFDITLISPSMASEEEEDSNTTWEVLGDGDGNEVYRVM
ncbi:MAG: FHA domain-containing protein [Prochlorothrix sp.]